MKKHFLAIAVLIISVLLTILFTGFEFKNLDTLMKPPMVEGENRIIQLAFENFAGEQYRLVTPLKGDHRSAYNFFDLNGDGDDEVIVFYSKEGENDIVRMNILDKNNDGSWVSIADIGTEYSDVQQVEFADLNGDKIKEIIVGWTVFQNEYVKTMDVYTLSKRRSIYVFEKVYNSTYYDFRTFDIDCDSRKDILKIDYTLNIDRSEFTATYLDYSDDEIKELTSINLDLSFSSITSIASDYIKNENRRRIYFDGPRHESGMITDCIFYNNDTKCFQKEKTDFQPLSVLSSRISNIFSKDVNNDGVIEIPKEKEILLGESTSKDGSFEPLAIEWVQIKSGKVTTVSYEVFNSLYGYSYKIDKDTFSKITVENDLINGEMTFYQLIYTGNGAVKGEPLFTIYTTDNSEETEDMDFRYKSLYEKSKYSYFCKIYSYGEEIGITRSGIKRNMTLN